MDAEDLVPYFIGGILGIFIGIIIALCFNDEAIKREQHRKYRLSNTNSVVSYEEWAAIKKL